MAALAFEPLVMQMADSAMPEMSWKMVETHLAWDFSWRPRHRLDRLTEAILELFLRACLPADDLNLAVQQEPLFEKVVADLSETGRGRRLLDAWADVLEHSTDAAASRRRALILKTFD